MLLFTVYLPDAYRRPQGRQTIFFENKVKETFGDWLLLDAKSEGRKELKMRSKFWVALRRMDCQLSSVVPRTTILCSATFGKCNVSIRATTCRLGDSLDQLQKRSHISEGQLSSSRRSALGW